MNLTWIEFEKLFGFRGKAWPSFFTRRTEMWSHGDGTSAADYLVSERIREFIQIEFGKLYFVSTEEHPIAVEKCERGSGFVVDPIDGSWNFLASYPTYCHAVSFVEEGSTIYFAIFNPCNQEVLTGNKDEVFLQGKKVQSPSDVNSGLVSIMYNTHYSDSLRTSFLKVVQIIVESGLNLRISGTPTFDLYCLLSKKVDLIINLSAHRFDAGPIIECVSKSKFAEVYFMQELGFPRGFLAGNGYLVSNFVRKIQNEQINV